jgi:hypothetical protein
VSKRITNVQDLLNYLPDIAPVEKPRPHVRYMFRGQRDATWKLCPGVYRPTFKVKDEDEDKDEADRLNLERNLMKDFRAFSAGLRTGHESLADLYLLQQHYRIPTRLLDWTNNALAALFFAVTTCKNEHSDGKFFSMDAESMRKRDCYRTERCGTKRWYGGEEFRGIATSTHPTFRTAIKRIVEWTEDRFPDFIIPVRPDYFDRRITLQRSSFTFHGTYTPDLTEADNDTLRSFIVPETDKVKIKGQLAQLGIDAFSIYGDLDHLGETLTDAYCSGK